MAPSRAIASIALTCLCACRGSQSALDPQGPGADRIYDVWLVMFAIGIAVFVIVTTLVGIAVVLPRRDPDERHRLRLVLGGAITTLAILIGLLVYNASTAEALATESANPIDVRIVGRQWWWDVTYIGEPTSQSVRTANELTIPVGRPIRITLESHDVIHSFWVPNLHGKRDLIPGRVNRISIQANAPGVYRGQCAEFCGVQHAHMALLVHAVPPAEYEAWLAAQRQPIEPPADELARRGQDVFMQTCSLCHALRGTLAMAAAGPDLTHVASRRTIAAATLPQRRGHLAGWIANPQHAKPGAHMPPMDLDSDSLHALLHFLEGLR